ncbi:glutathione S-transferase family protein [Bacteriovorax stolpii]|uniref:Glutathione S-transferase n=1 Tax=Bacteriovorax stolpii TaxID=960 RepID=A0A2K9NUK5_BACTC|nr:glutathione S-transferase family protein [Bacteriovorax stolpii]AUN98775.1 glutathione S-transferase [Bacteriovorax stolpii]QDK41228.1 glutathione S-transferase family protein [Bacteriovorax stolpii]TDP55707.1 glutathione S-transferase [Bacteriovorax stolpii]
MRTLYIANKNYSSWSLRPWLVLKAFNIPFEEKIIPFHDAKAWDEYKNIVPNKKVPCLIDDQTIVWDSLAIIEYLAEENPSIWPEDKLARAWARSASAQMHSGFQSLRNICGMNCGVRVKLNEITPALQNDLNQIDALWLQGLKKFEGPFLAGKTFSAIDAFFAPVIFRIQTYGLVVSDEAKQYVSLMLDLPEMKDWYRSALAEKWRDDPHEKDVLSVGQITLDHRS